MEHGSPLTGADVAYTINLAKTNPAVSYSNLVALGMIGATASGNTVTVAFKSPARTRRGRTSYGTMPSCPNRSGRRCPAPPRLRAQT